MTTETSKAENDPIEELREKATALEQLLGETRREATARLVRAELKFEAMRAGMVDLDGLKLIDQSKVVLSPAGDVDGVPALIAQLKQDKPWLFAEASSSSPAIPPPAKSPRQKHVSEMTDTEYRAARAALLKRRH